MEFGFGFGIDQQKAAVIDGCEINFAEVVRLGWIFPDVFVVEHCWPLFELKYKY